MLPSISNILKLFITEDIVDLIVKHTNIHALRNRDEFVTDSTEIYNFIGILIYQGFQKDSNLPIAQLYDKSVNKYF